MLFPPILVINLPERTDRWERIQKEFIDKGWPSGLLHRIDASKTLTPWVGCFYSHLRCVEFAKLNNFPWILVLEDDCLPTENSFQRFQGLLPVLWHKRDEWDIFSGANLSITIKSLICKNPPLVNIAGSSAHFCLINQGIYDSILRYYDINVLPEFADAFYSKYRMICTYPHLATQFSGYSNLAEKNMNHDDNYNKSNEELLEFLERETHKLQPEEEH